MAAVSLPARATGTVPFAGAGAGALAGDFAGAGAGASLGVPAGTGAAAGLGAAAGEVAGAGPGVASRGVRAGSASGTAEGARHVKTGMGSIWVIQEQKSGLALSFIAHNVPLRQIYSLERFKNHDNLVNIGRKVS